nr:hypothetical protein [Microthrixaceae bacterium]
ATLRSAGFASANAPVIAVLSGGVLSFPQTMSLFNTDVTLSNAGTVRKEASAGLVRLDWPIVNTGIIQVVDDTLDLRNTLDQAGGTLVIDLDAALLQLGEVDMVAGGVTIDEGGMLQLQGGGISAAPGNHIFAPGTSITGAGTLRTINAASVTLGGTVGIDSLLAGNGTLLFTSTDTVNINYGSYTLGGVFGGTSVVAIDGIFDIAGGNAAGSGVIYVRPSGTLNLIGPGVRGWDLVVDGTMVWGDQDVSLLQDPGSGAFPSIDIRTGAELRIAHGATDRAMIGTVNTPITNSGTIRKATGTNNSTFQGMTIANTGGEWDFLVASVITVTAGCSSSGAVFGGGTVIGTGCTP